MPQVISGGQLLNVRERFTNWSAASKTLRLYADYTADYAAIYRTQPHVRRVVSFLANNIAQLKIKAYRRVSDDERQHVANHEAERLLANPNPWMTRFRYARAVISDLAIYDDAVAVKVREGGQVRMLLPIPPSWVHIGSRTAFHPSAYLVSIGGQQYEIPAEDVIHIHGYNPLDPVEGLSPMESLRRMLAEEDASGRYRESFWTNSARQELVITRPAGRPWSPEARSNFLESWSHAYGGPDNAGKTPVLEDGMDIKSVSVSSKDAEYIASRKFSLEEAAGVYHVSPPLVGLLDEANFGSQTAIHRQWLSNTVAPWTVAVEEEYTLQLSSDFEFDDVYLEHNIHEKLKGAFEEEAQLLQSATGAPWMTRNEARARRNLPPVPGGDDLVTPLNVLIGGQASPQDSSPNRPDNGRMPGNAQEAIAASTEEIQKQALNGAQIASLVEIVTQVAAGQLPLDTAKEIMLVSFPLLDEETVERILAPVRDFTPAGEGAPKAALAVLKAHIDRQERAFSRLDSGQAELLFDAQRWNRELTKDLCRIGTPSTAREAKAKAIAEDVNGTVVRLLGEHDTVAQAFAEVRTQLLGGDK